VIDCDLLVIGCGQPRSALESAGLGDAGLELAGWRGLLATAGVILENSSPVVIFTLEINFIMIKSARSIYAI